MKHMNTNADYVIQVLSAAIAKLDEGKQKQYYNILARVEINFSNRMTRAAGYCKYTFKTKQIKLQFSNKLFARMTKEQIDDTITHEFAHAIEFAHYGDSDHGARWMLIHQSLGGSGKQYHRIECADLARKTRQFIVKYMPTGREYRVKPSVWAAIDQSDYKHVATNYLQRGRVVETVRH